MPTPLVSVVLPVYNVAPYLERCLDSLVAQTWQNFEVIAVNDGSTDGSLEILDRYQKKIPAMKIVNQENQGLGPARNVALDMAKGDYIYCVDSDDYLADKCLETCVRELEKSQLDVVFFSTHVSFTLQATNADSIAAYFQRPRRSLNKILSAQSFFNLCIEERLTQGNGYSVVVWGYMYRSQSYNHMRFKTKKFEDEYFTTELLLCRPEAKVKCLADRLYYHIIRSQSLSTSASLPQRVLTTLETFRILLPRAGELTRPATVEAFSNYMAILLTETVLMHFADLKIALPAEKLINYLYASVQELFINSSTAHGLVLLLRLITLIGRHSKIDDHPEIVEIKNNISMAIENKRHIIGMCR
jgi:glycosyltransferase involved in cell wall biosynthesis